MKILRHRFYVSGSYSLLLYPIQHFNWRQSTGQYSITQYYCTRLKKTKKVLHTNFWVISKLKKKLINPLKTPYRPFCIVPEPSTFNEVIFHWNHRLSTTVHCRSQNGRLAWAESRCEPEGFPPRVASVAPFSGGGTLRASIFRSWRLFLFLFGLPQHSNLEA